MRTALSLYLVLAGLLLSQAPGRPVLNSMSVADAHVAADSLPPARQAPSSGDSLSLLEDSVDSRFKVIFLLNGDTTPYQKNIWWIDDILKKAPVKSYIFQSDASGSVSWLLFQPDTATCKVYQRTSGVDFAWSPKFRAGQELRLKEAPFQTVKVASFDDYNSGKASYPILIFEEPYYNVQYLGYWSYLAESALID